MCAKSLLCSKLILHPTPNDPQPDLNVKLSPKPITYLSLTLSLTQIIPSFTLITMQINPNNTISIPRPITHPNHNPNFCIPYPFLFPALFKTVIPSQKVATFNFHDMKDSKPKKLH